MSLVADAIAVVPRRTSPPARASVARRAWRRPLQLAVTVGLLAALAWAADWRLVAAAAANLDPFLLAASLALFVPQTMISAVRWQCWSARVAQISFVESLRQVLASSALNLVLPSKVGDLTKAAMLPGLDARGRKTAAALAATEKLADVAILAALMLLASSTAGARLALPVLLVAGGVLATRFAGAWILLALTILLWLAHLAQIHVFMLAAGVETRWSLTASRVPAAIFIGLLPVGFCGIGPRDAALVWLFADVAEAPTMAVVGLLTALRYLVPGAAGIALVGCYLPRAGAKLQQRRAAGALGKAQAAQAAEKPL